MTFRWLPDAELDPHPRLTWLTECGFDLAVLALYRKVELLPENYRLDPGTLVVSNHQRDADVPILTTVLCQRRGRRIRWPLPFFASREDFFRRGFLAGLLYTWPPPARWLLRTLSLAWFFRIVRSTPLRRVGEYTLAEAWQGVAERSDRERTLNARGRREWRGARRAPGGPAMPVALRPWGLRRLRTETRTAIYPGFRLVIDHQLERFAALLDAGRVVYFAPEGTISTDGRIGRMRAGLGEIVRRAARPPRILPLALSYDPLGPGRLRVIIRVGTPVSTYNANDGGRFNAQVEMSIRELYAINASHLLSRFLVAGPAAFSTGRLAGWLCAACESLRAAGCTLDPMLEQREAAALAVERLQWLRGRRLVARAGSGWRNAWPPESRPGWGRPARLVRYLDNALADHLAHLAPTLELDP